MTALWYFFICYFKKVATRLAYGNALARLGQICDRVIALDGDTKNSTFSIKLFQAKPNQFIECFIAEQNLVGVGIGCGVRGRTIPFVSTFAAFLTRAYDQIRMGAVSQTNCNFAGSHVGVSIGRFLLLIFIFMILLFELETIMFYAFNDKCFCKLLTLEKTRLLM